VHGRIKNKHSIEVITSALTGFITNVDVEMLRQCTAYFVHSTSIEELELLEKQQTLCLKFLEELADRYFAKEISLLCTIPSIKKLSAMCILAELGGDLSAFHTAAFLVSWAGLRPRNDESAGKIRSRKTLHGNKYLRHILVQVSWSAALSNNSFFGQKYRQLSKRMKPQKALLAITRKLLVVIYNVLTKKQEFDHNRNTSRSTQSVETGKNETKTEKPQDTKTPVYENVKKGQNTVYFVQSTSKEAKSVKPKETKIVKQGKTNLSNLSNCA